MKSITILATCLAVIAVAQLHSTQAYPQRVYVQKLPYYPPPTRQPQIQRARRDVKVEHSINTKPNNDVEASLIVSKDLGNDKKAFGTVTAQGNPNKGGVVGGALGIANPSKSLAAGIEVDTIQQSFKKQAEANLRLNEHNVLTGQISNTHFKTQPQLQSTSLVLNNDSGFKAGISRDVRPGVGSELTKFVSKSIDHNDHRFDGTLFHTNVKQSNGFNFDKTGGQFDYKYANDLGLKGGLTHFSNGIGNQATLSASKNLFTSKDGLTSVNTNVGGSKWLNGPFSGQRDYNFGFGVDHRWRG